MFLYSVHFGRLAGFGGCLSQAAMPNGQAENSSECNEVVVLELGAYSLEASAGSDSQGVSRLRSYRDAANDGCAAV